MYTVYVLYSIPFRKTYTGYTSDFEFRFKSHNELATKGFMMRYRPWIVLHTEVFATKQEVMRREKEMKIWTNNDVILNAFEICVPDKKF